MPARLRPRGLPAGALVFAALAAGGCEHRRYDPVPLYKVRGSFLFNDAPLPGAVVRLYPADPALAAANLVPHGRVADDGAFVLTTYEQDDGAPAGDYAVTVVLPEPRGKGPPGPPGDQFGGRYADPKKSKLHLTIRPGDDTLEPLRITGPSPAGPPAGRSAGKKKGDR